MEAIIENITCYVNDFANIAIRSHRLHIPATSI